MKKTKRNSKNHIFPDHNFMKIIYQYKMHLFLVTVKNVARRATKKFGFLLCFFEGFIVKKSNIFFSITNINIERISMLIEYQCENTVGSWYCKCVTPFTNIDIPPLISIFLAPITKRSILSLHQSLVC